MLKNLMKIAVSRSLWYNYNRGKYVPFLWGDTMNYNSLIEIGSKANVILRFKAETTINGKTYAANEPYLYLKDCNVLVNYSNQDKSGITDINVIANSDIKARTVVIGGISFTRKLASLLASFDDVNESFNLTKFLTIAAQREEGDSEGVIFITDQDLIEDENLFVYDANFEPQEFTYDSETNSISSEDFTDATEYLITYSSARNGTKFDLNKPHIPYMSLEVQGIGNIDKVGKNVVMYFDKVSLNSILEFTFIQGDMINVPLQFYIIDDKNNYVVFED